MTKCRCVHRVPWFWICLACLADRAGAGWHADSWDGFQAVRVGRAQRLRSDEDKFWIMTDWLTRPSHACKVIH